MSPSQFKLTVTSFSPPTLPEIPADTDPSCIRSPHIPNILSPTSPLRFTVALPGARESNALHPATHLQMSYCYKGTGDVFSHDTITSKDLLKSETDEHLYAVAVRPQAILRAKVNHSESPEAEVRVRVFRNEKLLGTWLVGRIEKLGLEGFKSEPIHLRRVEQWKASSQGYSSG